MLETSCIHQWHARADIQLRTAVSVKEARADYISYEVATKLLAFGNFKRWQQVKAIADELDNVLDRDAVPEGDLVQSIPILDFV
jgi:hypothetical protein